MPTTSTARIANDSPFCEAYAAMNKVVGRLLAMALRDLMQGHVNRCSERERRVEVVGADGVERRETRMSSRQIETSIGEVVVKQLLYTNELRRVVAEESAKSSFDEGVELIAKRTGASVPKRHVEELAVRAAQDTAHQELHPMENRV